MTGMPARVKFRTLLAESARLYFANGGALAKILLIAAVATAAIFLGTMTAIQGFSIEGANLDPKVFRATLTGQQWVIGAAGLVAVMIALSLAFAASVHAAARATSVKDAFSRIRSGPMQVFWLQCVIYALALRFQPLVAPLLFVLIAFAVPVALREDLGPNAAADRAWELSEGSRARILFLELGLILISVVITTVIGVLFLQPNSPFIFLAPVMRAAISWILMAFLIAPFQFLFVALTRLYEALTAPALHARAASSVNS
jgi:hypothetical protein